MTSWPSRLKLRAITLTTFSYFLIPHANCQVKDEVQQHLAKLSDQADDTRRMTLNVLTITGLDYAYFKLGQDHKLDLNFRENLGGGIMRNMLRVQSNASNTETYCVILLCMSRLAQVCKNLMKLMMIRFPKGLR